MPNVIITGKEVEGICSGGHKVGNTAKLEGDHLSGSVCPLGFNALFPYAFGMQYCTKYD